MRKISIALLIMLNLLACKNQSSDENQLKESVTVSILPQKYFVEKLVGDHFKINVMIPPGASPVTYEPSPKQMKELAASNLYIRIGYIEFEKSWMKKLQNIHPDMKVLDQSSNANLIQPEGDDEHDHDHAHHGHHHHGVDPHIWTSPREVKSQMDLLSQYFISEYPELEKEIKNNYLSFVGEIEKLDSVLTENLEAFKGRKFLIFHPALSYFARDYGMEQISIELDGKEPTPSNIQKVIELAKKEEVRVVFVQKQFSTHNAEVIAKEINGRVVQIDPLDENWEESIKFIADEIVKSYSQNE